MPRFTPTSRRVLTADRSVKPSRHAGAAAPGCGQKPTVEVVSQSCYLSTISPNKDMAKHPTNPC
jgi:hypothetical protein